MFSASSPLAHSLSSLILTRVHELVVRGSLQVTLECLVHLLHRYGPFLLSNLLSSYMSVPFLLRNLLHSYLYIPFLLFGTILPNHKYVAFVHRGARTGAAALAGLAKACASSELRV